MEFSTIYLRSLSNFTIGTFNVRGLSSAIKRDQLSEDLNRLHIDVCCIQETKCPSGFDVISGYYRLIGLPSTSRHYGLAFAVASYLAGGLLRYWSVSDRLAVIQLTLGTHSTLTIINAYGPTSQVTLRNQDTQDDFYAALDSITTRYSSSALILIAGDFNSKLGKKTPKRTLDRRAYIHVAPGTRMAQCSLAFLKRTACLLATPLFNTLHVTRRRGKVNTAMRRTGKLYLSTTLSTLSSVVILTKAY